jgi:dephospho-CoA kinase
MAPAVRTGFRLGVTGGIGSGKTSVCRVFDVLGIPVYYTDREARDIMENDQTIRMQINSLIGRDMYRNGFLDRMTMADIIFNDRDMLMKVNSIVHPAVFERFIEWEESQDAPYVIMEAAILFESGASKMMNRIATVVTPEEERISRVIARNRLTRQQVMERMKNQLDDEERIRLSDYVIFNSENNMILPAILKIHEDILINLKKYN